MADRNGDCAERMKMAIKIIADTIAEAVVNRLRSSIVLTPRLLTLSQAATYLGLTADALKAKVHMGRIPTEAVV